MSEQSEVTAPLKKALEALGCLVYRMPTGGYRGRMLLLPKGTPDLLVFPPPTCRFRVLDASGSFGPYSVAAVETKKAHKDDCKCDSCVAQRDMRVELEKRGVLYVHARSVDAGLTGLDLSRSARAPGIAPR